MNKEILKQSGRSSRRKHLSMKNFLNHFEGILRAPPGAPRRSRLVLQCHLIFHDGSMCILSSSLPHSIHAVKDYLKNDKNHMSAPYIDSQSSSKKIMKKLERPQKVFFLKSQRVPRKRGEGGIFGQCLSKTIVQ